MKQIIKVEEVEGGFYGCILCKDRIMTALFFPYSKWNKDQVVKRLNKYL